MKEFSLHELRYPIGEFLAPDVYTPELIRGCIEEIAKLPYDLPDVFFRLSPEQFNTPYRPQGWTINQVVHHIADSHVNSYIRFKLALTEENPSIKPYFEDRWANLADNRLPPSVSIVLLEALHLRWATLLRSLSPEDLTRSYYHPEQEQLVSLQQAIAFYAWHGKHHLAQIQSLKTRMQWK